MKDYLQIQKSWIELVIVGAFILLSIVVYGPTDMRITSDGLGYYDHLYSVVHYQDYDGKHLSVEERVQNDERYSNEGIYVEYDDHLVNKYSVGTAVLVAPFYVAYYHLGNVGENFDPIGEKNQNFAFVIALLFLLLGLIYLRKFFNEFGIQGWVITWMQVLLLLSTNVMFYVYHNSSYSHIFSFFAITTFLYFTTRYFQNLEVKPFFLASLCFGLVILLRPVNGLVLLFVPFLMQDRSWKEVLNWLSLKWLWVVLSMSAAFLIIGIQCWAWYTQTGHWLIYSYQNEGFNWLQPEIVKFLFSFKKGAFIYHPILLLSFVALVWVYKKGGGRMVLRWLLPVLILFYVLSAWWSWYYGASFGQRVLVDYMAIFFLPIAIMIQSLNRRIKIALIVLSLGAVVFNLIQAYQYQHYIYHWGNMDKHKYKKVFMKLDLAYGGWIWKHHEDESQWKLKKEVSLPSINSEVEPTPLLFRDYTKSDSAFLGCSLVKLSLISDFKKDNEVKLLLNVFSPKRNETIYEEEVKWIFAANKGFGFEQDGHLYFKIPPLNNYERITLRFKGDPKPIKATEMKLSFYEDLNRAID